MTFDLVRALMTTMYFDDYEYGCSDWLLRRWQHR
jgi:hypothetical protein